MKVQRKHRKNLLPQSRLQSPLLPKKILRLKKQRRLRHRCLPNRCNRKDLLRGAWKVPTMKHAVLSPFFMNTTLSSRKKILAFVIVLALLAVILVLDMRRRRVEDQLTKLSVSTDQVDANSEENKETARRVTQRVGRLMVLPADIEPTVATIVNIDALRSRNAFYNSAENGDYLLVTPTRAILYSDKRNIILDVAPVQVGPARPTAGAQ